MESVYAHVQTLLAAQKRLFVVLIDPQKCIGETLDAYVQMVNRALPDLIFVGGSQLRDSVRHTVAQIKSRTSIPVVLFPGDSSQFTDNVDALLVLTLISGRNSDLLIGQHVAVSKRVKESGVETISTGYILIDGGKKTAVQQVSNTEPLATTDIDLVVSTALAGELIGNKLIYLEAGSGASHPIPRSLISAVKAEISIPLIVGGGLTNVEAVFQAYKAGADIVVVGNLFETHLDSMIELCAVRNQF